MVKHISWNDEYKIGYHLIDSQHRRLFEIADEIYSLTQKEEAKQKEDIILVLQDCTKYTLSHFSTEEKLMEEIKYPAMNAHINQHKEFKVKVTEAISDYSRGNSVKLEDLYLFIVEWLVQHVTKVDKALGLYASTHQVN
ncbi:MAG: hemerythrin family protein [Spirochaetaceae bacterium]|nr:hemerythrin family protein [Spirochaetaceae bacterium]